MGSFWVDNAPHTTSFQAPGSQAPSGQSAAPSPAGQTPFYLTPGQQSAFNDYKAANGPTSVLTQQPRQDFNVGGFQPSQGQWNTATVGEPGGGGPSDPRLTTQPQPYQQGPIDPSFNIGTDADRQQRDQQLNDIFKQMGGQYQPGPYGRSWTPSGGGPGALQGPMSTMGDFYGNAARAVQSPMFPQAVQRGLGQTQQQGQQIGSAIQPMNPSQQSGQVGMMSPTGQFQYVNAEHVPHYQSMGATIHNGSSYGSQSGGF